jgi:hypothetical protein
MDALKQENPAMEQSMVIMMAPLVMQWSQAIKRQNPTTIQTILPMMTPMVMQWMETMQQQDPAMAQVMLATWLDEQPRKADAVPDLSAGSDTPCEPLTPPPVATAPGTSKMAALMVEAIGSAQDDDESCRWSEAGSF